MPYYEFDGKIDRTPVVPDSRFGRALEPEVRFRGAKATDLPGLLVAEMTRDQKDAMRKVLGAMLETYREAYRERVTACLDTRVGEVPAHLLQGTHARQGRGVGQLAGGRPGVRVVLPRLPARSHLGPRRREPGRPRHVPLRMTPLARLTRSAVNPNPRKDSPRDLVGLG